MIFSDERDENVRSRKVAEVVVVVVEWEITTKNELTKVGSICPYDKLHILCSFASHSFRFSSG